MSPLFTNSLINESSPYLLQHAHNPVNWYAWGDEAISLAKQQDKVILVSIGYSACHWCHVMEKESFENEAIAALMNEHFICIKIDREERPDLDHIYMDAVQAISGSGGWPLNVFLTPDTKPFYGGTYYPPIRAFNRTSWPDVLQNISSSWKEKRSEIEAQADNLTNHISQANNFTGNTSIVNINANDFTVAQCHSMFNTIMQTADKVWGGFGNAPKFPQTFTIKFLLQYQHLTGNKEALEQALLSIDKMLAGGIYDHIDGGLARYSTDKEWLAPHFEKMLYDNALLVDLLCDAWQITRHTKYKFAIEHTIAFIKKELLHPQGGFYAALDADSEGVEGKYYVWQKAEIETLLGNDATIFCAYFNITSEGNWEESNILRTLQPLDQFCLLNQLISADFKIVIDNCITKLAAVRAERIKPALDDKIILSWNALMLKAIAKAAVMLQNASFHQLALTNFNFLIANFSKEVNSFELLHTYKNGIAKYSAFLDDYAFLIEACLEMYYLDFDTIYLQKAKDYTNYVVDNFSDAENIFFLYTNQHQSDIILRKKEIYDGAIPSGNSIMATNLLRLSVIFDEAAWKQRSFNMLMTIENAVLKFPGSHGFWASLLQTNVFNINEIAVIGLNSHIISNNILYNYIPYKVLLSSQCENDLLLLLRNKPVTTQTLIYLCKNFTCLQPFNNSGDLINYLNQLPE